MKLSPIVVIGATGYIGGRLVPLLLEAGYRVRVVGRSSAKLHSRPWAAHPKLEIAVADVLDFERLKTAVDGCRAAYYLVNFMHSPGVDFEKAERQAALNMVRAASVSSLERLIYFGWLEQACGSMGSKHLRARCETAQILGSGRVPLTCLRAAVVLGSGSASFEILRYIADRQPVMFAAPWMQKPAQPISIRNALGYLTGCLDHDETIGRAFDIGGPEILTYEQLIQIYAEVAELPRRYVIPVAFISPQISALWTHLVTPLPARVVRPIAEELSNGAVCGENSIRSIIPLELLDSRETIRRAIAKVERQQIEGRWSDAGPLTPPEWAYFGDEEYAGGAIMECGYRIRLAASPEEIWERIVRIGGEHGWYYGESLWKARGWLDKLFGGTSLSRGRRHPTELFVGDALDFWRVLRISAPHRLLLLSEMKTPGEALLEFRISSLPDGTTELQQLSRFRPKGLPGLLYWYILYPAHQVLFHGMLRTIARAVGKRVLKGPERFTNKLGATYALRL
ncbi:MAG: SDR family oxidoreductase [Desulfobacteraceae bacterium]|nr:SDR family oxidoreductase [Desulfobacteraceae bacterium]